MKFQLINNLCQLVMFMFDEGQLLPCRTEFVLATQECCSLTSRICLRGWTLVQRCRRGKDALSTCQLYIGSLLQLHFESQHAKQYFLFRFRNFGTAVESRYPPIFRPSPSPRWSIGAARQIVADALPCPNPSFLEDFDSVWGLGSLCRSKLTEGAWQCENRPIYRAWARTHLKF